MICICLKQSFPSASTIDQVAVCDEYDHRPGGRVWWVRRDQKREICTLFWGLYFLFVFFPFFFFFFLFGNSQSWAHIRLAQGHVRADRWKHRGSIPVSGEVCFGCRVFNFFLACWSFSPLCSLAAADLQKYGKKGYGIEHQISVWSRCWFLVFYSHRCACLTFTQAFRWLLSLLVLKQNRNNQSQEARQM